MSGSRVTAGSLCLFRRNARPRSRSTNWFAPTTGPVFARQVTAARQGPTTTLRLLWANGYGDFRTKGRYASATVRGTIYSVTDRCDGTPTTVQQGFVAEQNLVNNTTFNVSASQSSLVKP